MMKMLENKKILITGGSMGIGFTVAQKCAEAGANVVLISRHEADLKKAVASRDWGAVDQALLGLGAFVSVAVQVSPLA